VKFKADAPTLNLAGLTVSPITCKVEDESWSFQLPSLVSPDTASLVTISLLPDTPNSERFAYDQASGLVTLLSLVEGD